MKFLRLASLAALVFVLSSMNQPLKTYTITALLDGLADGTRVQLVPGGSHEKEDAVAEAVVTKGKVVFKGSVDEPRCFLLLFPDANGAIKLMVENSNIEVSAKAYTQKTAGAISYQFKNETVKGSKVHEEYLKKSAPHEELNALYEAYHNKSRNFLNAFDKAKTDKKQALVDSLQNSDDYKQFEKDEHDFFTKVEETFNKSVSDNKDTWWGPFMMLDQTSYLTPDMKNMYESLSDQAKESYYGKKVKEEIYPAFMAGQKVQDFKVVKANGQKANMYGLISGKKYILIDFWASWCHPCRAEIPNLKNLYKKYSGKGFEIISISIDEKEAAWQKAVKEEQLLWPNFRDVTGIAKMYKIKAVPSMLLLDENGTLIANDLRGEALAEKLEDLFSMIK